jgi:hypothetical protein
MNPIKNLWSILKKRLGKTDCSTEERMVTNMIEVWFHDNGMKNICCKLVESLPNCIQVVILAKGGTYFLIKLCDRIVFEGLE